MKIQPVKFETYRTKSLITVAEYKVGVPLPGILYEQPNGVTKPNGDEIGPHCILLIAGRYMLVFPGTKIIYDGSRDGLGELIATEVFYGSENGYERIGSLPLPQQ